MTCNGKFIVRRSLQTSVICLNLQLKPSVWFATLGEILEQRLAPDPPIP